MTTAREFYRFLWESVPSESITQPQDPYNPKLTAKIDVNSKNIDFLKECENLSIFTVKSTSNIELGTCVDIERSLENPVESGVFFDDKDVLRQNGIKAIEERQFYIGNIDFDSNELKNGAVPEAVNALIVYSDILKILQLAKYLTKGSSLVFFGKDTVELNIKISLSKYDENLKKSLACKEVITSVTEFKTWFEDGDSLAHQTQKKAVINNCLFDLLWRTPESERLLTLLNSIEDFVRQSIKSYELYLEEFSYSRFTKKLDEKRVEYFEKISRSLLDIKNQIIGLPLSYMVLSLAKNNGGEALYFTLGMSVYCLILCVLLRQQKIYLADIGREIKQFTQVSSQTSTIKSEVDNIHKSLKGRIKSHNRYINFFYCLVFTAFIASWYQYFPNIIDTVVSALCHYFIY